MTVTSRWRKAAEITAYKQQLNAFIMNIWYPANRVPDSNFRRIKSKCGKYDEKCDEISHYLLIYLLFC